MAVVDITEYDKLALDNLGARVAAGVEPAPTVQQITTSGASAACAAAFDGNTKFVRVHTSGVVRIKFGVSPVAAATSQRMAAGSTEYFGVTPGIKMAAIDSV